MNELGFKPVNGTRLTYTTNGLKDNREIALVVPNVEPYNENDEVHFGDAGNGRAVAWARFGDARDGDGSRVLVIDEIQSRRHQDGREKGYINEELEKRFAEARDKRLAVRKHIISKYNLDGGSFDEEILSNPDVSETDKAGLKMAKEEWDNVKAEYKQKGNGVVPDAPFDKNWHELAMKRMLRYAAENGYDKVAWTTGTQQAERYGLRSVGDKLTITRSSKGLYHVDLYKNNEHVVTKGDVSAEELPELIGKELAERVLSEVADSRYGQTTISGEELSVGGEGMKGFYDQMLPKFMDKYGKKWGVKTADVTLDLPNEADRVMHSVDVTPEMKESVMEGQPMFFRTEDGEVYGYTKDGKIYVDPKVATSETPIHEYTHLWSEALRQANPKAWAQLKKLMVKEQDLVDYVKKKYPEITDEDALMDEVFAHYSGKRGKERLDAEMREAMEKADGMFEKAQVANVFGRIKDLLSRFWNMARDLFSGSVKGLSKMKAEDFADMAMNDLLRGFNPNKNKGESKDKPMLYKADAERDAEYIEAVENDDTRYRTSEELDEFDVRDRIAEVVGASGAGRSKYARGTTEDGQTYTIRVSNHAADEGNFDRNNEGDSDIIVSFVVSDDFDSSRQRNDPMTDEDNGRYQFVIDPKDFDEEFFKNAFDKFKESGRVDLMGSDVVFRDGKSDTATSPASMRSAVEDMAGKLNVKVRVVENAEEITDSNKRRERKKRKAKGYYDLATGEVVVVLPNHATVADAMATVAHEVIGHKGMRELVGEENYPAFLDEVYSHLNGALKERIDTETGRDFMSDPTTPYEEHRRVRMDELFAEMAEKPFEDFTTEERTFWQTIKDAVRRLLDRLLGGAKLPKWFTIGDNEIRYMLWRAKENLERGKEDPIQFAQDIVKRRELGIDSIDDDTDPDGSRGGGNGGGKTATDTTPGEGVRYLSGAQTDTPAFKRWFGNSKVVDEDGEPLVVYHMTPEEGFYTFDKSKIGDTNSMTFLDGFYFGNKAQEGSNWRKIDAYLAMEHPLDIDLDKADFDTIGAQEIADALRRGSYSPEYEEYLVDNGLVESVEDARRIEDDLMENMDGVIIRNTQYDAHDTEYIVFEPNQIKSATDNNGEYSSENDDIRYRIDDTPKAAARDEYERMVKNAGNQFTEAMQDSMVSLKNLYLSILGKKNANGKKNRIEDVADHENAYLAENRMQSMSAAQTDAWEHDFFQPIVKIVNKLTNKRNRKERKAAHDMLTDYMMAKHGLERNEVMAMRDARKAAEEKYGDQLREAEKMLDNDPLDPDAQDAVDLVKQKMLDETNEQYEANRERDYAGLTALTGKDDIAEAEEEARKMVEEYEAENGALVDELWNAVNKATRNSLQKVFACGLMDYNRYQQVLDMFDYYIPLQGFDENVAEDVYAYMGSDGTLGYGTPIRTAKGRKSKADDPIATIMMNGAAAIRQGNRNLMKQRFLNFVQTHPSDLVSIQKVWLRKNDVTGEWEQYFDADLQETDTPEQIEQKVRDFEEKMEGLAKKDPDHYMRYSDTVNIPFRVLNPRDMKQHQVMVRRNGKVFLLTINGNPRAAQALNGLSNPDNKTEGAFATILGWLKKSLGWLSKNYTTRNPAFVLSNFLRDALYSNSMVWTKESPNYAFHFNLNFGKVNPAFLGKLYAEWESGSLRKKAAMLSMNSSNGKVDQLRVYFNEFMANGGETGYTNLKDIEQQKRDLEKMLRRERNMSAKAWNALGGVFDLVNSSVENCARFAAYVTSREMGRSVGRSIYDAKQISVNFNKKGAGDKFMGAKGQTALGNIAAATSGLGRGLYVFWNASVQGLDNIVGNAKRNPLRTSALGVSLFGLGAVIPLIAMALTEGDDDDDKDAYYNLPEYVRRSNICFRWSKDMPWITIPLPVEYRALYGLGELSMGIYSGKERLTGAEIAKQYVSQLSQVMPLDFMEGEGGLHAFVPSYLKPLVESETNKSWSGLPIYRDDTFKKNDPKWTLAYESVSKPILGATKLANEVTGGSDVTQGVIDLNPAKIEYLMRGYLGGPFTMINQAVKAGETIAGKREFEWRSIPIADRVLKNGDERTEAKRTRNRYFDLKDEYDKTSHDYKKLKEQAESGREDALQYAERMDALERDKKYGRYFIMSHYEPIISKLNDMKKEAATDEERKSIQAESDRFMHDCVSVVNAYDDGKLEDVAETMQQQLLEISTDNSLDPKLRKKAQTEMNEVRIESARGGAPKND